MKDFEKVEVTSRQQWRDWLTAHPLQKESIWLVTYKKHTDASGDATTANRYLAYDAIVEEALCFGWIDSLPRRLDADRTMLLLSPRKRQSVWSKLNKTRVEKLIADGLMRPAGLEKVQQAQADGTWTFLDDVEALIVPDDLAAALADNATAAKYFEGFSDSAKKGILQWIKMAKQAPTRQQRIEKTVTLAAQNIKAH
ncbi:MAG: YdeI/OmpD-associated family protein [Phormidesmis sp.]